MNFRRWLITKLIDWDTAGKKFEYTPADKVNIGLLHGDDTYHSLKKILENLKYDAQRAAIQSGDVDNARGQFLAAYKIEHTIERFYRDYKRTKKS